MGYTRDAALVLTRIERALDHGSMMISRMLRYGVIVTGPEKFSKMEPITIDYESLSFRKNNDSRSSSMSKVLVRHH